MKKFATLLLGLLMLVSLTGCFDGETKKFPEKSLELIIPWSAGGGTDVAGRLYASYIEKELGQTINVLNVPGGNSAVGAVQVKNSKADGYTMLLLTLDILTVEAQGLAPVGYKDFKLLSTFTTQPTVLAVRKDSGWKTIEDYKKAALANPGGLKVGTNGEGAAWHQGGVVADNEMGTKVTYVPYTGSGEQTAALLGGHIDAAYISYNSVASHVKEGTLVALGVLTADRVASCPDVPTFAESGYRVIYSSWRGLGVPKDTPDEVAEVLRKAAKAAFDNEEFRKKCEDAKIDMWYTDHNAFMEFLASSYKDVKGVMTQLGFAK